MDSFNKISLIYGNIYNSTSLLPGSFIITKSFNNLIINNIRIINALAYGNGKIIFIGNYNNLTLKKVNISYNFYSEKNIQKL